jgi:hypothetical protein
VFHFLNRNIISQTEFNPAHTLRKVEMFHTAPNVLGRRRRKVDDDGRAEALPFAVVLADRRPHARVREAGVDQDPVRERDRVRGVRGRARPGRERVRHKRAEAREIHQPAIFVGKAQEAGGVHYGLCENKTAFVVGGKFDHLSNYK